VQWDARFDRFLLCQTVISSSFRRSQFYSILNVATLAVHPFVNPLRTLLHVGNNEAGIVFGIFFRRPDDFRFDHQPASMRPFASRVVNFSVDMFRFSAAS
jgi:hypothetical protein